MYNLDIKSHVKQFMFYLGIGTITSPQLILRLIFSILLCCCLFFYATAFPSTARDFILKKGIQRIEMLYEILPGLTIGVRLALLVPYLPKLRALLNSFDELDIKDGKIILSYVEKFNRLFKGLVYLWIFEGTVAVFSPFILLELPFANQRIPFITVTDNVQDWQFWLTLFQQNGFLIFGITSTLWLDGYPALILALISGFLEEISNEVRKISHLKGNDAKERLINCYKMYQKAVELEEKFSYYYSTPLSIQCAVGAISICALMVKLSLESPLVNFVYYARNMSLFLSVVLEIAFINIMGSEVIESNLTLSNALYDTNWHEKDVRFRKLLILFQQRTQKLIRVRIGFIFVLELYLVQQICNIAYRLYAVLMKMNNV